jgi:ribosome biogenesis protein NSA1
MAVGTAYKQVRLYDVRESSKTRRPTATTPEGLLEYRVMSLCQVDDYQLVVGDAVGDIYSLDIRSLGRNPKSAPNKNMGRYVGPAGSIRQMKKHPTLPRLAAVGLDRMLRIYDTNKRKLLDCVYLKQRLNSVLFDKDGAWELGGKEGDDVEGGDEGDWDIDQDDVVEDYVDSEDEGNGSDRELISDEKPESEEDSNSPDEEEDDSAGAQQDDSVQGDSGDESSDQASSSDNEGEDGMDATGDADSVSDEEIVIKAPKKRRRQ